MTLAFSPDGKTLAAAADHTTVQVWDIGRRKATETLKIPGTLRTPLGIIPPVVDTIAFSPDGKTLATGHGDDAVRLWSIPSRTLMATLRRPAGGVESVAFAGGGRILAAGTAYNVVLLWDVATKRYKTTLNTGARKGGYGPIHTLTVGSDGRTLAAGSMQVPPRLWELPSGKPRAVLAVPVESEPTPADPRAARMRELALKFGLWHAVTGLSFSPDGQFVATSHMDGNVRLWEATSGRRSTTLRGHTSPVRAHAFSPDGKTLGTASEDHTARLWEVASGRQEAVLSHLDVVTTVVFSPDGRTLGTGCQDGMVRLWDTTSRRLKWMLRGHTAAVIGLAFAPGGKVLVSGSEDKTARLWDITGVQ